MAVQAATDIHTYYKGTVITHYLTIKVDGKYTTPTAIQVWLTDPTLVQTGPFTPTKLGVGRYSYQQATSIATVTGQWQIRWAGTGTAQGDVERKYVIQSSDFV